MKSRVSAVVLGLACFALGAAFEKFYDAYRSPASQDAETVQTQPAIPGPSFEDQLRARVPVDLTGEPLFAYGFSAPAAPGDKAVPQTFLPATRNLRPAEDPAEQTRPRHVAGSAASYSLMDIRDASTVYDWFPDDHPPMPEVVAHGPAAWAAKRGCRACHHPNGRGRPENAPTAGLPVSYFVRQMEDFRNGLRYTADPRKPNTNTMIQIAQAMTDEELKAAAEYFAAIKWTPYTRVVETDLVPKTRIAGNLFIATEKAMTEPIAGRIIEVPEDEEQSETLRNPHSGFVAYVPVGSIEKGKDLVTTGGMKIVGDKIVQGKTTACSTCHGLDLGGVADVPPIAGMSPSYIVRQIYDMQRGTRNGASAQLMKLAIARLTPDDMVAIAAYVASLVPPSAAPNVTTTN